MAATNWLDQTTIEDNLELLKTLGEVTIITDVKPSECFARMLIGTFNGVPIFLVDSPVGQWEAVLPAGLK